MLIVCPSCATSYQVEAASLGAAGRTVRCVRCRHVWFARDPEPLQAIAQAHRSDIAALVESGAYGDTDALAHETMEPPPASTPDSPPTFEHTTETGFEARDTDMAPVDFAAPGLSSQLRESIPTMDAPSLAPTEQDSPPTASGGDHIRVDIETSAARKTPRRAMRQPRREVMGLSLAILALVALNAALISWRTDVVKAVPQTASLYAAIGLPVNLRGLSFAAVTTKTETHDGVQVLVVEGTIASVAARIVEVPRIRFSVRNKAGQEVYSWTALPERNVMSPGEPLTFRSRLASPPLDMRDVLVRFFNRRDLIASSER